MHGPTLAGRGHASATKVTAALDVLGYSADAPIMVVGAFVWWVGCQTISALLLAMEDDE